jgi:aryl-phospho-beta-D-glucosidase BglC (GH1 family)
MPRRARIMLAGFITVLAVVGLAPDSALASHQQVSILEEDAHMIADPAATLQELRHLGVEMIRVPVHWSFIAPHPNSFTKPSFDAADPNAYPAATWAWLDATILDAQADGIQVLLNPAAFAPLWAQAPGAAKLGGKYNTIWAWEPSPSEFGQFVRAIATRYSGSFVPPGSSSPLPHVSLWEIYNEPNTGEALGPETIDDSRLPYAPRMYRALADAAWSALQATGHAHDTVLIGALGSEGYRTHPSRKYPQGLPMARWRR